MQLEFAWEIYADDHNGQLADNLVMTETGSRTNSNWVNNVMTWDTSSDNTNLATITRRAWAHTQRAKRAFTDALPTMR